MTQTESVDTKGSSAGDTYFRVSALLFENPKLAEIADEHGALTYTIWLHLLAAAKRANCLGRIVAPPVRVARLVGADVATTKAVLDALEAKRSIIRIDGDRDNEFQIRNWHHWQSMTPSERSKKHREKVTANATQDTEAVTPETNDRDAGDIEDRIGEDRDRKVQENMSAAAPSDRDDIKAVFAHWSTLEARTGGIQSPKLTAPRARRICARLKEGYTVEQLCLSVSGFMSDNFHLGKNEQKTRYTGLDTLMKSGDKVEAGIKLAGKYAGGKYDYLDD